jgi:glucose-6-phosphate 1-epimerase
MRRPAEGVIPLTKVRVSSHDGASVEVHLNGAHVTSWRPAPGDEERLFLSTRSSLDEGAAIRGGIPVIFPQFGTEGPLPRHGFARTARWTLDEPQGKVNGDTVVSLSLTDSPATRAIWPASFRATLTVRFSGITLATTLTVENTGNEPFHFAAALHTYLRVHDVRDAEIVGLRGCRYRESSAPDEFKSDDDEILRVEGEINRVYVYAPSRLTLREPRRELAIETTNFPDVVIWNPGSEKAAELNDMEPSGEQRMLCIEAAVVQTPVVLEPGRRWSGTQTMIAAGEKQVIQTPEDDMSAAETTPVAAAARDEFAAQLRQLEEFVARAESTGDELPPEVWEMKSRLDALMRALDGLAGTMDGLSTPLPNVPGESPKTESS